MFAYTQKAAVRSSTRERKRGRNVRNVSDSCGREIKRCACVAMKMNHGNILIASRQIDFESFVLRCTYNGASVLASSQIIKIIIIIHEKW